MVATKTQTWAGVLKKAEYPADVVVIDFETYFDGIYSLRSLSTIEYVTDKQFEILGVAIRYSSNNKSFWYTHAFNAIEWLQNQYGASLEGCTVLAQNARFDLCILAEHFNLIPKYFIDLMGIAYHVHPQYSASLADMCKLHKLKDKGDTQRHKGMTRRRRWRLKGGRSKNKIVPTRIPLATPKKERELATYAIGDVDREWELFEWMMPKFSRPEVEIPLMQHTIELFLKPCIRVDEKRAERIRKDMINEVDKAANLSGYSRSDISGNISFQRILSDALVTAGDKLPLKPDKNGKMIPAIAQKDSSYSELLNHSNQTVRELMKARVAVRAWPSKAKRVNNILKQHRAAGGKLPVPLKYHGAHTGRWSGDEQINLHNLGAHGHPLDAEVRNVLLPPPEHVFIVADQSAVEARGTAWVAGQTDLLALFKAGVDVYCDFASNLFSFTVREPRDNDPDMVVQRLKSARNCGKVGILGGGYGMGPLKCQAYGNGYGLTLSSREAHDIIHTYRSTYPKIVQFWKDIYKGFHWTYKTNRESTVGPIKFYADINRISEDVVMVLPSGHELRYANVAEQQGEFGLELVMYSQRQRKWSKIYGGYLTENIVQAMCRDTLAEAILRLENLGIHTCLHVHDEIVCAVPTQVVDNAKMEIMIALQASPTWAPDLPLDAKAIVTSIYEKP